MKVNIDKLTRGSAATVGEARKERLFAGQRLPEHRHIRADTTSTGARQ